VGKIVHEIEKASFEIVALQMMRLSTKKAEELYRAHRGKPFYLPLIRFVTSGPLVALILERNDAVRALRRIVGATDPEQAREGTLRKRFGTDVQKNAVHAAETDSDAQREIPILFGENPQN
jgi:nucleoside-diphosphate kinase